MSKMSSQKNQLVQMSESQMHPNLADPADFEVISSAEAVKATVPACYNLNPAEYKAVCDESAELHTPPASGKSGLADHPRRK